MRGLLDGSNPTSSDRVRGFRRISGKGKLRRSIREYDPRPLAPQVLSELLWAAYGVNRPTSADRTAPSWRHARETDVFAAMADGIWRYDAIRHVLAPHLAGDVRAQTGVQDFVGNLFVLWVSAIIMLGMIGQNLDPAIHTEDRA